VADLTLKNNLLIYFADNVSEEVLNQLLYHLLEDGILNDGEVQHIIQANQTRANKARDLIRTVRMKGDESSWRMINWIKSRDPKLADFFILLNRA
uniref:CARD domain-containing protein n=1 Tax=Hippocampus comes TaxID=109280 RepID=A0A3Q2XHS6_HIPCM